MPLEIYLDLISQPCRSVYIFAKKNNITFEFKKILLFKGEQYSEEFGKFNFFRKPLGAGVNVFEVRPKLSAWKDRVRAEIGPALFDEAHQMIFNAEEMSKTIDPSAKEIFKPKIKKMFL
nr:glutathione S-transferase theta-3-like [Paramormyrops kingsleyae]